VGPSPVRRSPATLSGAFLRGAKLAKADLTGIIANNLNLYSIGAASARRIDGERPRDAEVVIRSRRSGR